VVDAVVWAAIVAVGAMHYAVALISSPLLFSLETRAVLSDLPYLFTSLVALLLVERLDRACSRPDTGEER
jgi:hypothetical protein